MRFRYQYIDFRISRRTLWIGMHAYPLQSVARVRPLYYRPDRGVFVWTFVRRAAGWIAVGLLGWMLLSTVGSATPAGAKIILTITVLAMLVLHSVRLARGLGESTLYALCVETAGAPHMALVSRDEDLVYDLIRRVVEAIDNPSAEFEMRVENIVLGDKIDGDKFVGDKVGGDKIAFWAPPTGTG